MVIRSIVFLSALLAPLAPGIVPDGVAQEPPDHATLESVTLSEYSHLWLTGSASVRDWRCDATRIEAQLSTGSPSTDAETDLAPVDRVGLDVPVAEIRCDVTPMERDLYRALRAKDHPAIEFRLDRFKALPPDDARRDLWVSGRLTVAGQTRNVSLVVDLAPDGKEVLRATGSKEIRMTDFGVEPPTAFLGLIKAHDRLTVHFDLSVRYEELARRLGTTPETLVTYVDRWVGPDGGGAASGGTPDGS